MALTPMRLLRIQESFDHPDFIFEPKLDGFRALADVRGHRCELVSRHGHTFKQWPPLAEEIAHAGRAHSCVLDGAICCRKRLLIHTAGFNLGLLIRQLIRNRTASVRVDLRCPAPSPRYRSPLLVVNA